MRILTIFLLFCSSLTAHVQNSILPLMDRLFVRNLEGKINEVQKEKIKEVLPYLDERLRVVSFNMLFNVPEAERELEVENRWEKRAPRLVEYLCYAEADIIGSQELQKDQLDYVVSKLGRGYAYYGRGMKGEEEGDIGAIFYKKDRVRLVEGKTYFFSDTPEKPGPGPFGSCNTFTVCRFIDLKTGKPFLVINTHLAFGNIERRRYEAELLREFVCQLDPAAPLLVTGDFNTFPFRQDLDLPFYDGDEIVAVLEDSPLKDGMTQALLGHFGLIDSSNFCQVQKRPFCSRGTPGVILDHIFVNKHVKVVSHGIDPAKVDGYFTSDHFPVIADVVFGE